MSYQENTTERRRLLREARAEQDPTRKQELYDRAAELSAELEQIIEAGEDPGIPQTVEDAYRGLTQ